MRLGQRKGEKRHRPVGLDLKQPLDEASGLARMQAVVVDQQTAIAILIDPEIHEGGGRAARHLRPGQRAWPEQRRRLLGRALGRILGRHLDMNADDEFAGYRLQPVLRHPVDHGVAERRVGYGLVGEEGVGRELRMPFPFQAKIAQVDGKGVLRLVRALMIVPLTQLRDMAPFVVGRVLA